MKIKVCKDYSLDQMIYESDRRCCFNYDNYNFTNLPDYSSDFETVDVTEDELMEYIKKGYAIKINC